MYGYIWLRICAVCSARPELDHLLFVDIEDVTTFLAVMRRSLSSWSVALQVTTSKPKSNWYVEPLCIDWGNSRTLRHRQRPTPLSGPKHLVEHLVGKVFSLRLHAFESSKKQQWLVQFEVLVGSEEARLQVLFS